MGIHNLAGTKRLEFILMETGMRVTLIVDLANYVLEEQADGSCILTTLMDDFHLKHSYEDVKNVIEREAVLNN